uniref:hypothetical protein n=1 Tax=Streptomyces rubrogriseus TaxID=194673 RepID=UPI003564528A
MDADDAPVQGFDLACRGGLGGVGGQRGQARGEEPGGGEGRGQGEWASAVRVGAWGRVWGCLTGRTS